MKLDIRCIDSDDILVYFMTIASINLNQTCEVGDIILIIKKCLTFSAVDELSIHSSRNVQWCSRGYILLMCIGFLNL